MKPFRISLAILLYTILYCINLKAQFPMPPKVPIWDANVVNLQLHKITNGVYAISPSTTETETTKGIPQATSGGFVIGEKGVLMIECMLNKRLFDQQIKLIRSVTNKPILYAVNTSDHGDHCFTNYLLPASTIIIQNEFAKENLAKNFENIKQFMIMLFGKGRGIEDAKYRAADITIAKNDNLKIDLGGGTTVEFVNVGTAQSPADLFVFVTASGKKAAWLGNPFIAESPTVPWLFDGYFLDPVNNLQKIYDQLNDADVIIPGHGRITNKAGIKYTIEYVNTLKQGIEEAVKNGKTLDETKELIKMKEFDKGYQLFNWLHYNFNIPNAYKDIKAQTSSK